MLCGSALALWSGLDGPALAAGTVVVLLAGCAGPHLRAVLWFAAGLAFSAWVMTQQIAQRWPVANDEQRVLVELRIDSLLGERGGAWNGDGEIRILRPDIQAGLRRRIRFSWPMRGEAPQAGETWQLLMRLTPPRARLNPGGIDMERQFLRERIDSLGRVLPSTLNLRLRRAPAGLLSLRESIAARLRADVVDRDAGALFAALAVGATAQMSGEQWRVFNATGTTHLVAISGLHVTLFAWLMAHVARRAWRIALWLHVPLMGRCRRESFALVSGWLAAAAYSLLAGFSIPAQRTLLMLACHVVSRTTSRDIGAGDLLGAACIGVLLLDPLAPLAAGFWLSFGAMAALMVAPQVARSSIAPASAGRSDLAARLAGLRAAVLAQCWLAVALVPITLVIFNGVSLAGWLANFAAIPLFSFVLVPLTLVAALASVMAPALATLCLSISEQVHALAWPALVATADAPLALWQGTAPIWWYAVSAAALAVWRLPGPVLWRVSALWLVLPLLVGRGSGIAAGAVQVVTLDLGSGRSVLLRTASHAVVYDTGETWGSDGAAVTRHLAPLLRALDVREVDLLVLSRADASQVIGAARLLGMTPVHDGRFGGSWRGAPMPLEICPAQRRWSWDRVQFELVAAPSPQPSPGEFGTGVGRPLRGSCLLRVTAGGRSVLLAPSLTTWESGQRSLLEVTRHAVVLLAPQRATSTAWVAAASPDWIVVSRRATTDRDVARLAQQYQVHPDSVLATDRTGPLRLDISAAGRMRWSALLDPVRIPTWRVPREPP